MWQKHTISLDRPVFYIYNFTSEIGVNLIPQWYYFINPSIKLMVTLFFSVCCWLNGPSSVYYNFLKGREAPLPYSYRSTYEIRAPFRFFRSCYYLLWTGCIFSIYSVGVHILISTSHMRTKHIDDRPGAGVIRPDQDY